MSSCHFIRLKYWYELIFFNKSKSNFRNSCSKIIQRVLFNFIFKSIIQSNGIKHTRIYYLNTVTTALSTTVREIGFGWSPVIYSPTLFSRIRLTEGPSGSAVTLSSGQELIILYELVGSTLNDFKNIRS